MLNLNHLRLFTAAAEVGSVSAAATLLRLSQPALSKQIRELEAVVGMPLLERQPRGVKTTAAGDLLLTYARQLFDLEAEAEQALADLRGLRRGRLRLGASMTIGVHLVPRLLAQARLQWPDLNISCKIANTENVQQALLDRRIDMGLVEGPGSSDDRLSSQTFLWDELIVVVSPPSPPGPALRLVGTPPTPLPTQVLDPTRPWTTHLHPLPIAPAQLGKVPWITRETGSGTLAFAQDQLRKWNVRIEPAWMLDNAEAVLEAVAAGLGVALVPLMAVEDKLAQGRLVRIPVRGLDLRRPLRAQWDERRPLSVAAAAFLASLSANASEATSSPGDN